MGRRRLLSVALFVVLSCELAPGVIGDRPRSPSPPPPSADRALVPSDVLDGLLTGGDQLAKLCMRGGQDTVSRVFCAPSLSPVRSLRDLQARLNLAFADATASGGNGTGGNPAFVLSGHSQSLVGRFVSPLSPRAFVFTPSVPGSSTPNPGFVAMAFTRGESFVEVAAHDPSDDGPEALNFYLIRFVRADDGQGGSSPGERLLPAVEQDWQRVDVYEDGDLENTILDCTHCHQPGGPGTLKILRMHERTDPWTHFLRADREGGWALLEDYHRVHGDAEDYGGIPASIIDRSDPSLLAALVENNGFRDQPNPFDAAVIEREVDASNALEPAVNTPPGQSPTWQRIFAVSLTGDAIPPPYHDAKAYDALKLSGAADAYRSATTGALPLASLPDLRDVFLDDALVELSVRPPPDASGREILVQMCKDCHNASVDPTLSRARFDATALDAMPSAEKLEAIARLRLPPDTRLRMPPVMFRSLSEEEIAKVVAELER
jgi:hypothetical protein